MHFEAAADSVLGRTCGSYSHMCESVRLDSGRTATVVRLLIRKAWLRFASSDFCLSDFLFLLVNSQEPFSPVWELQ
jgi:hypothetical protein